MYVYRLSTIHSSTDTNTGENRFGIENTREHFYSSRAKALEVIERRVDRRVNRCDYSILNTIGDKSLSEDTYSVELIDSEESYKQYGYYTIVTFTIDKIEVL